MLLNLLVGTFYRLLICSGSLLYGKILQLHVESSFGQFKWFDSTLSFDLEKRLVALTRGLVEQTSRFIDVYYVQMLKPHPAYTC